MSKRKNRDRSPNIPQATLERARRQAEELGTVVNEPVAETNAPIVEAAAEPVKTAATATAPAVTGKQREERRAEQGIKPRNGGSGGSARRTTVSPGGMVVPRPRRRKSEVLSLAEIEDLLEHPTKTVTEAELHADYGYVLSDLRNMGVLAAVLFIFLIVLAQIL